MKNTTTKTKKRKGGKTFQVINPNAAGIDIGSEVHYVAVPEDRDPNPIRCFKCFTSDLNKLADWLEKCGIETVVMESTGVYWIPLYQILEKRGFEVCLVNARHVKNVPGRKTDIKDCQWLQQLHSYGLLAGSFRPSDDICVLRSYIRQRDNLIKSASVHIQRMQKALTQMNIQLHKVISDITGVTGMKIMNAILKGERDPVTLAKLKHRGIKSSTEKIAQALEGDYRKEHLFSLEQELELYETYKRKISACDSEIEKHLQTFESRKSEEKILKSKKPSTYKRGYEPQFDLTSHLIRITGVDLTAIQGIEASLAQTIISEIGLDMSSGIKLYLHQVVITKTIPFKIITENGLTYEEEEKLLKESKKLKEDIKKGKVKLYKTAEMATKNELK